MFWSFPLRNWDEAWYAEIIKNMASGNYNLLVPFWNGQYYFDKPPLYFWLSLPIVNLFGVGEWQVRLISILAFIGILLLIYLIGKRLFSSRVGILSSLIFISLGQVFVRLSHGNLDSLLIFFILLSFYFYLLSINSVRFSILTGISLGLGFLVKGWVLGLYPLLAVGVYGLIVKKRLRNWKPIFFFSAISSAWYYVLGYLAFGWGFFNWYILTVAEGSFGGFLNNLSLSYSKYFIRDVGVWALILPLYLIKAGDSKSLKNRSFLAFMVMALLFVAGISFLNESGDWHLLPAYPFVAICLGYLLDGIAVWKKRYFFALMALFLLPQMFVVYKIENIYPDRSVIGADLGIYARSVIRTQDTVVLDDHDFTSFLFYANTRKVYTPVKEEIKAREWWTIKEDKLADFVQMHKPVLFISKNLSLAGSLHPDNLLGCYLEYCFFRYE